MKRIGAMVLAMLLLAGCAGGVKDASFRVW